MRQNKKKGSNKKAGGAQKGQKKKENLTPDFVFSSDRNERNAQIIAQANKHEVVNLTSENILHSIGESKMR